MKKSDLREIPAKRLYARSIMKIVLIVIAVKALQVAFVYYSGLWYAFLRYIGW